MQIINRKNCKSKMAVEGNRVWVPHIEKAWVKAEVLGIQERKVTVRLLNEIDEVENLEEGVAPLESDICEVDMDNLPKNVSGNLFFYQAEKFLAYRIVLHSSFQS